MTPSTSATSRDVWPKMPMLSSDDANATRPYREMRPYVGLKPTTPHSDAGCRTEPPVSLTQAPPARHLKRPQPPNRPNCRPEHALHPMDFCRAESGDLIRRTHSEFIHIRLADDDRTRRVEPLISRSRHIGLCNCAGSCEPHEVRMPFVQMLSLTAIGKAVKRAGRRLSRVRCTLS